MNLLCFFNERFPSEMYSVTVVAKNSELSFPSPLPASCSCHGKPRVTTEAGAAASRGALTANSPFVCPGRDTFRTWRTPAERGRDRYAAGSTNRI